MGGQALADDCMDPEPKRRPSFVEVQRRLRGLTAAAEREQLTPTDEFAVYHGWQTEYVSP